MTTRECPMCDGLGHIFVGVNYHHDEPPTPYGPKCETCDGEGFIESDDYEPEPEEPDESFYDDMDGDHASALASAGFGTDEDYGCDPDTDYENYLYGDE